jgi:hypothetical protein
MSDDRAFERALDDWLADGTDRAPRPAVTAVLLAIKTTPQERGLRTLWRSPIMSTPLRLAAAIAIVAVVGIGGLYALDQGPGPGTGGPAASPSPTAPLEQSASPSRSPSPSPALADPSTWPTYTSDQYGFTIGYPADWTVEPATRAWTYEADGRDFLTAAADAFIAPGQTVRVSAWAVPLAADTTIEWADLEWSEIEAWVEAYCPQTDLRCAGISERAVPMCIERRDCHQGALLIPFADEVQAFVLDFDNSRMVVISVWWGETALAVRPYGGAQALLEAFLETMNVWHR